MLYIFFVWFMNYKEDYLILMENFLLNSFIQTWEHWVAGASFIFITSVPIKNQISWLTQRHRFAYEKKKKCVLSLSWISRENAVRWVKINSIEIYLFSIVYLTKTYYSLFSANDIVNITQTHVSFGVRRLAFCFFMHRINVDSANERFFFLLSV